MATLRPPRLSSLGHRHIEPDIAVPVDGSSHVRYVKHRDDFFLHGLLRLISDRSRRLSLLPHLVAKRYHPALVRFRLNEVQGDILIESVEKWYSFTD
jgi:hypothetical protein